MRTLRFLLIILFALGAVQTADATRIKELAQVKGVRSNPLIGYGLVVGLSGTGDTRRTLFTQQSLSNLLRRLGVNVDPARLAVRNTAAVMVTAEIPPYSDSGDRVDVVVSALGDARSLTSGTLLMTPLEGPDGQIYAVAQGQLVVGGFEVDAPFAQVRRNFPTSARIPDGATIERAVPATFVTDGKVVLTLEEADFTTAGRIVEVVNQTFGERVASALSPGQIEVTLPSDAVDNPVAFIGRLETLDVQADSAARVVFNERSGTVVVGGNVTLGPAAVAHGNLNVAVITQFGVSQPAPFSRSGRTVVVPNTSLSVEEDETELRALPPSTTVEELVRALNALGASPRDLMAILEALKAAGSLKAELEIL
ncbi:MAG: flagellar basal body P-ring protein FlgI [Myxococcota bacterium]